MIQKSVLVVDDDPAIRDCVAEVLEYKGYHVAQAADGASALRLLAGEPPAYQPSLIILDYRMPQMNGENFLRSLLEAQPELFERTPVLLFSAALHTAIADDLSRKIDYLQKPVDLDELIAKVETVLAKSANGSATVN